MKDTMLLFDLDGTLWDSGATVAAGWNAVLTAEQPGREALTTESIHRVMGRTMDEIAETLFSEPDPVRRAALLARCEQSEMEYIRRQGGVLMPGVLETLERLRERGYRMAVVSNCQTGYVPAFFETMGLGGFFCDYEEWGRTGRSKGENIRLVMRRNGCEDAWYIGDTRGDARAAKEAGIPFIHAAYGFGEVPGSVYTLERFAELEELFE